MDGQTAEMPPLLAWGFGLLLVLLPLRPVGSPGESIRCERMLGRRR